MFPRITLAFATVAIIGLTTPAFAERVIVKCQSSCDSVVLAVERAGGPSRTDTST